MDLLTPLDSLCRIIIRAREYEAQVSSDATAEDPDSLDDLEEDEGGPHALSVLSDDLNTGVEEELRAMFDELADDQIAEVLALAWVGRGTYDQSEWDDAYAEAADNDPESIADMLMDMGMLAGFLEAGLAAFDLSCDGVGQLS